MLLLTVLAPLFALIAVAIWAEDHGPVIFSTDDRPGLQGRSFRMYKFRSMVPDAESQLGRLLNLSPTSASEWHNSYKLRRDPRVTRVGSLIRRLSLDELPQLVNVVRGDMSLVGPRPTTTRGELWAMYGEVADLVLSVRPGLTGLWQVSGRSALTYERRVALDSEYCMNVSLLNDLSIVARTIVAVVSGRGAY